jgi:hypothetical protein
MYCDISHSEPTTQKAHHSCVKSEISFPKALNNKVTIPLTNDFSASVAFLLRRVRLLVK